VFKEQQQQQQLGAGVMASLGAAIAGSVESLCLPRRRLMNSKSPRSLGGTLGDNCSSIQQPYFQCVLKVRMAASPTALCIAVLQLSSTESRPPDAVLSQYFNAFGGNESSQSQDIDLLQHLCDIWRTQKRCQSQTIHHRSKRKAGRSTLTGAMQACMDLWSLL
jgi:hypothetical protein